MTEEEYKIQEKELEQMVDDRIGQIIRDEFERAKLLEHGYSGVLRNSGSTVGFCPVCNSTRFIHEPSPTEPLVDRIYDVREVTITPLDLGYTVRVGCQKFAFTSQTEMIKILTKYLANPSDVERRWLEEKKL